MPDAAVASGCVGKRQRAHLRTRAACLFVERMVVVALLIEKIRPRLTCPPPPLVGLLLVVVLLIILLYSSSARARRLNAQLARAARRGLPRTAGCAQLSLSVSDASVNCGPTGGIMAAE